MSKKWGRGPTNCECRTGLWECVSTEQSVIDFWRLNHMIAIENQTADFKKKLIQAESGYKTEDEYGKLS